MGLTKYRMPPEWSPHAGTWVAWPHNKDTWPQNLHEAQDEFMNLVGAIAKHEHVYIACDTNGAEEIGKRIAANKTLVASSVILCDIPTNDAWMRDYGPTFVQTDRPTNSTSTNSTFSEPTLPWFESTEGLVAINWQYNAWGDKYPPYDNDQQVATMIVSESRLRQIDSKFVIEGGALEINDNGILLVTNSCILDDRRNPGAKAQLKSEIESEFKKLLGAEHIIWLPGDEPDSKTITGDDTDGHIDQLIRFVDDETLVYASCEDRTDPQCEALERNVAHLRCELKAKGIDYNFVPLPLPSKPIEKFGNRLPASYCNFYITNGSVIVPQFDDPNDARAVSVLSHHFPDREVVGLPSNNLSVGLGSFHCLTQQMPRT